MTKSEIQKVRNSESQKFRKSEIQRVRNSESQKFRKLEIRVSEIQKVRNSESQKFRKSESQKIRKSEIQKVLSRMLSGKTSCVTYVTQSCFQNILVLKLVQLLISIQQSLG